MDLELLNNLTLKTPWLLALGGRRKIGEKREGGDGMEKERKKEEEKK